MRHRDPINRNLDIIDSKAQHLRGLVNTSSPIAQFIKVIEELQETVDQVRTYIEQEPMSPGELGQRGRR